MLRSALMPARGELPGVWPNVETAIRSGTAANGISLVAIMRLNLCVQIHAVNTMKFVARAFPFYM
jgi:hypothetical protein